LDRTVDLGDRAGQAEQISVQSMGTTLGRSSTWPRRATSHPSDGRRFVLSITKSGTRVLSDKHNGAPSNWRSTLGGFHPLELRQLMIAAPLIERLRKAYTQ